MQEATVRKLRPAEKVGKIALAAEIPDVLRKLADSIEAGDVTEFLAAYLDEHGYYHYLAPSSLTDSVVMASLLQANMMDRYRGL